MEQNTDYPAATETGDFATDYPTTTDTGDVPIADVDVTQQIAKDAGDTAAEYPHTDQVDVPEQIAKDAGDPI